LLSKAESARLPGKGIPPRRRINKVMSAASGDESQTSVIKVVYFDEESASDYLDVSTGGKSVASSEQVRDGTVKAHQQVEAKLEAKFSWLPFLGSSATVGGGLDAAQAGQSILRKTLSNTILTDYLASADQDERVSKLRRLRVTAPEGSMAYTKMFTPYMVMLKIDDAPFDLARMDETLAGAKGLLRASRGEPGRRKACAALQHQGVSQQLWPG
jgi:Family of unknown function (DUF6414)